MTEKELEIAKKYAQALERMKQPKSEEHKRKISASLKQHWAKAREAYEQLNKDN